MFELSCTSADKSNLVEIDLLPSPPQGRVGGQRGGRAKGTDGQRGRVGGQRGGWATGESGGGGEGVPPNSVHPVFLTNGNMGAVSGIFKHVCFRIHPFLGQQVLDPQSRSFQPKPLLSKGSSQSFFKFPLWCGADPRHLACSKTRLSYRRGRHWYRDLTWRTENALLRVVHKRDPFKPLTNPSQFKGSTWGVHEHGRLLSGPCLVPYQRLTPKNGKVMQHMPHPCACCFV